LAGAFTSGKTPNPSASANPVRASHQLPHAEAAVIELSIVIELFMIIGDDFGELERTGALRAKIDVECSPATGSKLE
jgi:hypothetical protein